MTTQHTPYQVVEQALRSQGARHSKAALEALTTHLMDGGDPRTYGERFAQMALQREGLLPIAAIKQAKEGGA